MDEELDSDLEQCLKDWTDLSNEYADLEELYTKYKSKLDELLSLQKKCKTGINHQKYRLKAIKKQMSHVKAETEEEKDDVKELGQDLLRRHEQLAQVGF